MLLLILNCMYGDTHSPPISSVVGWLSHDEWSLEFVSLSLPYIYIQFFLIMYIITICIIMCITGAGVAGAIAPLPGFH